MPLASGQLPLHIESPNATTSRYPSYRIHRLGAKLQVSGRIEVQISFVSHIHKSYNFILLLKSNYSDLLIGLPQHLDKYSLLSTKYSALSGHLVSDI